MRRLTVLLISCLLPAIALSAAPEARDTALIRYIVIKGDTLWHITAVYLKDPRKWTQIFRLNKNSIKDPNRIYLGQVIVLGQSAAINPAQVPVAQAPAASIPVQPAPIQIVSVQPASPPVISARVISIYDGDSQAGSQTIAILDKGRRDGVANGLVLGLYHKNAEAEGQGKPPALSKKSYGLLRVFRTYDKVSYATVTQTSAPIGLLDNAKSQ